MSYWTPEESAIAAKIYAENYQNKRYWGQGQTFELIAKAIGRTAAAVDMCFRKRGANFAGPVCAKYVRQEFKVPGRGAGTDNEIYDGRPPEHVLAERERRYFLEPRDLTAVLMGDPLPSCSALDMK